jgi:flagellar protein FliO/FliZ
VLSTTAAGAGPVAGAGLGAGLGQTALSLLLVLAAILALAWLLRRVQGLRPGGGGTMQIQGGLQVGARERVLMIRAGGKHLLIGVAPGSVQTLHVFDQPPLELEPAANVSPSFAAALSKVLRGDKKE